MNRAFVFTPLLLLSRLLRAVVGDVTWRPPGWAVATRSSAGRHPFGFGLGLVLLLALGVGGWWTAQWYAHRPKPPTVGWNLYLASLLAPDTKFNPQPLTATFDQSAVRLESLGKDVTPLVRMTPRIAGKWTCDSGSVLTFHPTENWPANTTFHLTFASELFSTHVRMAKLSQDFHTQPFSVAITEPQFYINPKDTATKQITATLTFTHAVDHASLEQNLSLVMEHGEPVFSNAPSPTGRCTFTYDKLDRVVYVRSVNIAVPKESGHALLGLPTSVRAAAGGARLPHLAQADVLVPAMADLFHIANATAIIVPNSEGEPDQVLMLTTSVGVKPEALAHALHAWELPKWRERRDGTERERQAWTSPAQVEEVDLKKSTPLALTPIPNGEDFSTQHSFRIKARENAALYLTVDQGLAAAGGFTLADKFASVCRAPTYPRDVHLQSDGALLALNGERKLSIVSRGVPQLEFRLSRVTPSSIQHLVSQSEGNFQSPVFNNDNFNETNISEQLIRRQVVATPDTSRNDYSALDFSEFVSGGDTNRGKLGLFLLRVLAREKGGNGGLYLKNGQVIPYKYNRSRWDSSDVDVADPADRGDILCDRRMVLVTDLGLLVKDNADGTHDIFVQSIKTGSPVGGAHVEVLGKNGLPVATADTDDDGHAALPSLRDFTREKRPVAYVVHHDDDVSFLPFGRDDRLLNFSRFDTSGESGVVPASLTACVFSDRGIYRPGDEAKLGLIVKQRNWQGALDGLPLRLDVVDPRGLTVQSRVLKLNAGGFVESVFRTRETSKTGTYQVNCYLVKSNDDATLLGSTSLRVAEFLPDRLKIKSALSSGATEGWTNADGLKALVSLQNLYGAPADGHRVAGRVTIDASQFSFDRYPDYTFTDPYVDTRHDHTQKDLPDQTTDSTGAATFNLNTVAANTVVCRLSFLAEGFEKEGGRSVTAESDVLVSSRAWLVGVKADGDLGYVKENSRRSVNFLAVDSHLKPLAVTHLRLKLVENRYVSVLAQQPNGNYAYQSVLKEIPVSEQELAISEKGLDSPLATTQPGNFTERLFDDHGELVSSVTYSVAGDANVTRSLDKNAELTAKLSKPEYAPGEEIEVEITAPYTGAGLLTIERDKVYAHVWFQAKTTSTVQKIRLPAGFEGNGYLNVAFVRALDSREIYMSPLSYAVVPFRVNREARHTHLTIDVPKVARPGEPLQMTVTASRPTQAVVYAVDEGILQVARYSLPDPLAFFFRKQALEVGTRQTVDSILPEYSILREVASAGGDGSDDDLANHLNPFKRKHDAPVVYWSGIVDLGPQAKTFTYNVPDYFVGTLRVMVVANTADAVGSEETKLQVRGPFVITPNVPTFAAPGDTFDVSVTVANNVEGSGSNAAVHLALATTDNLEVTQHPPETVSIAEGHDTAFHWLLRAKDSLGNADVTVTAETNGVHSSLASHLSVRPPVPYLTTLTTGHFNDDEKTVPVTRRLYPEFRKVSALASPLPQGLTRGLGEYLDHYAYGCTEQLVSKAFPTMISAETMQQGLPRADVARHIAEILDVTASRQNDEGAFGLWEARPNLHFDLPSAHILHFMTEAKEQGYDLPGEMMTRGLSHLQQDANGTPGDFRQARNQAYEIYLLARNGKVVTNALEHNRHWFEQNAKDKFSDDIAAAYEAATYALLRNQDQADAIIRQFHLRDGTHRWPMEEIDYDDDLGRAAQYIYLLARHFPERLKSLTPDDLMTLAYPIINYDFNTVSSAEAILALDTYGRTMKESFLGANMEIDEIAGGAPRRLELSGGLYPEAQFSPEATALLFKKSRVDTNLPRGVFYQISESGFDHETITKPMSEGLEVWREYQNRAGQVTTTAHLGEELTVVVHVRSTSGQYLENVALEDLLPGGFEIVEESARTGTCTGWGGIEYTDVREDRLLAFGNVTPTEMTFRYRIKATNRGTYAIPPMQAEAMYHQKIRARGVSGTLTVAD